MGIIEISSKENQYIKLACSLQEKKYRKKEKLCLLEGKTLISECFNQKVKIKYLFTLGEKFLEQLDVNFQAGFIITEELMSKMATTDSPPPLLAIAEIPDYSDPMDFSSQLKFDLLSNKKKEQGRLFLFCEDIQDPGNLGSIIRTAFAAGTEAVYLSQNCADIFNTKTLRSSMGSVFCGPVVYIDLPNLIENFKNFTLKNKQSFEIIGTSSYANKYYNEIRLNPLKDFLVLVGNESRGLTQTSLEACSQVLKIPLANNIESINVLAATSVILYSLQQKLSHL